MKLVTLNSILCSAFIIIAAQVHGILYSLFGMEGEKGVIITSIWALILPVLGIIMIAFVYLYQIILNAKHNFIRANNFIFVLMFLSLIMVIPALLNVFLDICITEKIYEITGIYIFSDTSSMYFSFLFFLLFAGQIYVQLRKKKYCEYNEDEVMEYNNNYF